MKEAIGFLPFIMNRIKQSSLFFICLDLFLHTQTIKSLCTFFIYREYTDFLFLIQGGLGDEKEKGSLNTFAIWIGKRDPILLIYKREQRECHDPIKRTKRLSLCFRENAERRFLLVMHISLLAT